MVVEKRSLLRRVTRDAIHLEDRFTGEVRLLRVVALVDAGYRLPDDRLWRETGEQLTRAGDAVAPRSIYEAILEGRRAALDARAHLASEWTAPCVGVDMSRYRYLFSPMRIGPVVVRNRIVFSAHLTNYAEDGLPTEQHAAYYGARAAGGAGLIVTEEHSTHPTDWPYEKLIHGFHAAVIPGYRRITDAVHRHGTPIFAQINHNGGQGSGMYSRLPVWAPSPVADPLFREVPKEIDRREIAEIVAGYATVASHCKAGGFDGIELQCSHSSIVRGFLSPAMNIRTDEYGGSLENRARLLLDIVAAVREVIGRDLALGVRLCGDELIEGGTTIDDAVDVARMVEEQGLTDYLNTSIGVATASLYMIEASMQVPPGYALFIPSALRKAVDLPVVGVGRFKDPLQAERALVEGHCDLVGVVRGQIADADFAAKARAGLADDIRLCLSCNQECVGSHGPQPVARLHREPADRSRSRSRTSRRPTACRSRAKSSSSAEGPLDCKPRARLRCAVTTWCCSKAATSWEAKLASLPRCRAAPSSVTSFATSFMPAVAPVSTYGSASARTSTR